MATTNYETEQDKVYYKGSDAYYNLMFTKGKAYPVWGWGSTAYCISDTDEKAFLMEDNLGLFMSLEPLEEEEIVATFQGKKSDYITQEEVIALVERLERYPCDFSCYATIDEMNGGKNMKDSLIKLIKKELLNGK